MKIVGFDTETELTMPGVRAPRLVCFSVSDRDRPLYLWSEKEALFKLWQAAADGKIEIIGHNIAYDSAVVCAQYPDIIPIVFKAYRAGSIADTMLREMFLQLERTGHSRRTSLADLARKYLGKDMSKGEDTWRLRYGELRDNALDEWPAEAVDYAVDDAFMPVEIYKAQQAAARYDDTFHPAAAQAGGALVLQLMTAWGLRTDVETVREVIDEFLKSQDDLVGYLQSEWGWVDEASKKTGEVRRIQRPVLRCDLSFDTKALSSRIEELIEEPLPRTEKGKPSLAKAAIEPWGLALAEAYLEYKSDGKMISNYLRNYKSGLVQCSVSPILTNGRAALSKPPLQNLPIKGRIRECFIPRPGKVFCAIDYDGVELRTLAGACLNVLGKSTLADIFRADPYADVHSMYSAHLLGISREEAFALKAKKDPEQKKARSDGKAALFGFPGGMGIDRFISAQKKKGNSYTKAEAQRLKDVWLEFLPEMRAFFAHVDRLLPGGFGSKTVFREPVTGHRRAEVGYTHLANAHFSTPMAYGAKAAGFSLAEKMYADPDSVLYGTRIVCYIHDEFLMEFDDALAHEQATEAQRIMCDEMQKMTPDVPITAGAALMYRWYKDAEPVYDESGRLIPWRPKK